MKNYKQYVHSGEIKTEVISHFRFMAEDMGLEPTGLLHLT